MYFWLLFEKTSVLGISFFLWNYTFVSCLYWFMPSVGRFGAATHSIGNWICSETYCLFLSLHGICWHSIKRIEEQQPYPLKGLVSFYNTSDRNIALCHRICILCEFCTFLKPGPAMSRRVTDQSNGPIKCVTNVSVSGVTVNPYWFIDSSFFCFRFVSTKALTQVLCPVRVINISCESAAPLHFLHHLTSLPFVWPAFSFEWICFVPLVSAQANLSHRHSFGLLFHPPTLGKTVCSKDCNLTANLYGFL